MKEVVRVESTALRLGSFSPHGSRNVQMNTSNMKSSRLDESHDNANSSERALYKIIYLTSNNMEIRDESVRHGFCPEIKDASRSRWAIFVRDYDTDKSGQFSSIFVNVVLLLCWYSGGSRISLQYKPIERAGRKRNMPPQGECILRSKYITLHLF